MEGRGRGGRGQNTPFNRGGPPGRRGGGGGGRGRGRGGRGDGGEGRGRGAVGGEQVPNPPPGFPVAGGKPDGAEGSLSQKMSGMKLESKGAAARGGEVTAVERRRKNVDDVFLDTRPVGYSGKLGKADNFSKAINLLGNMFLLKSKGPLTVRLCRVDFSLTEELERDTRKKKWILKQFHQKIDLGNHIFDGTLLYTNKVFANDVTQDDVVVRHGDEMQQVKVTIKFVKELSGTIEDGPEMLHLYNMIKDRAVGSMKDLRKEGKGFFAPSRGETFDAGRFGRLEVWPGYYLTTRLRDGGVMMCVDLLNKVVRKDTALDTLQQCRKPGGGIDIAAANRMLVGQSVMADYGNKLTYAVSGIDFNKNPRETFIEHKKLGKVNLIDYYKDTYQEQIKQHSQPLLLSRPSARNRRAGSGEMIYLVPELCKMTGLTDQMRADFRLMQSLSSRLRMDPEKRVDCTMALREEMDRELAKQYFSQWGFELEQNLVSFPARQISPLTVTAGRGNGNRGFGPDWTNILRYGLSSAFPLENLVFMYPKEVSANEAENFIRQFQEVCHGANILISNPQRRSVAKDGPMQWAEGIKSLGNEFKGFLIAITRNVNAAIYTIIKRECYNRRIGIPCQVVTCRNVFKEQRGSPGQLQKSVLTKVAVQVASKMGQVPWQVDVGPISGLKPSKTMVVGFDVYHKKKGDLQDTSYSAMTFSYDVSWSKYYSKVFANEHGREVADKINLNMYSGLEAYFRQNRDIPGQIIYYRDGVGEGQFVEVVEHELPQVRAAIAKFYGRYEEKWKELKRQPQPEPKLALIIVSKRISIKFFDKGGGGGGSDSGRGGRGGRGDSRGRGGRGRGGDGRGGYGGPPGRYSNPPPGTVVDTCITLPERFDFYLVSQSVNQGTVNPTSYSVVYNDTAVAPGDFQRITFALTHMYQNWSGTVRVPAPCMYAHKCAYLMGETLKNDGDEAVSSNLETTHYYL